MHTNDSPPPRRPGRRRRLLLTAAAAALAVTGFVQIQGLPTASGADDDAGPVGTGADVTGLLEKLSGTDILTNTSSLKAKDGRTYWLKNHVKPSLLSSAALAKVGSVPRRKYLVVWAGDNNVLDKSGAELTTLPKSIGPDLVGQKDLIGPDFFAVIDATAGSPSFGKVVNTATVGPLVENEPHHMQYVWHKGNSIFAGGLFTDVTYVLDASKLPALSLKGVNLPTDTLCGSVPDAYWVTKDGNAYGTYMGGPDVPGPCTYTDGQTRFGNGFAGSPGEVVRLDKDGTTLDESPATPDTTENEQRCDNIPALPKPSCANPHGIQAREDLNTLVTSDYNEPRNIILNPVQSPSSYLRRPTVRTWDISDKDHPKLRAVSFLPDGPRKGRVAHQEEPRAAMETTVTNQPGHKGAFAQTMQGGAIFYTPDITAAKPKWREVFDLTTSNKAVDPGSDYYGGGSNGGWVQTSQDDHYLYHAVAGRAASGSNGPSPSYILKLDISALVASGDAPQCDIDTVDEITAGGQESDCPAIASTIKAPGGPHWGALDNLVLGSDGYYHEGNAHRLAYSNYFVARTGLNGDHRVCLVDEQPDGKLTLEEKFRDENSGTPCVEFNRDSWPHGDWGPAKPHSMLFVTADDDIR